MNKLVLAVSADWHIFDWMQHSTLDEYGRPSRLTDYSKLAQDFVRFGAMIGADAHILAGDTVQSPTLNPRVLDMTRTILRELSCLPTFIIPGQHDTSTKESSLSSPNCVLTPLCEGIDNINLCITSDVYECKGHKIVLHPWNPTHSLTELEGDIFVGHGVVSGCSDHLGYMFSTGFKQTDLARKYKLSIIGDIHNGQVFNNDGRKILIPGTPVSNNFKDSSTTGFWSAIIEGDDVQLKFYPIEEISSHNYHKFVISDDDSIKPDAYTHVRVKSAKSNKLSTKVNKQVAVGSMDLITAAETIINESKLDNGTECINLFKSYVEKLQGSTTSNVRNVKVESVEVQNFLSIGKMSLDFSEFKRDLNISGANGSGKSSLCEAIYWTLTGKTTKPIAVASVSNRYIKDGNTSASVRLHVESDELVVSRFRLNGSPKLILKYNGAEIIKSSAADTQDELYKILGLNDEEIRLLCYFPAQGSTLFGDLTTSNRYSLVSKIIGLSEIDELATMITTDLKARESSLTVVRTQLNSILTQVSKDKLDIERLKNEKSSQSDITKRINDLDTQISSITVDHSQLKMINDQIEVLRTQLDAASRKKTSLESDQRSSDQVTKQHTSSIEQKLSKLKAVCSDATCYTCGQKLLDDKVEKALRDEIGVLKTTLQSHLKESREKNYVESIKSQSVLIEEITPKISNLRAQYDELNSQATRLNQLQRERNSLKVVDSDSTIDLLLSRIDASKDDIAKFEKNSTEVNKEVIVLQWLAKNLVKRNSKLYSVMIERAASTVQGQIDTIIDGCTFNVRLNKDFTIEGQFDNNDFLEYNSLSSGQKRVVDVVMMVALNNTYSLLHNLQDGVLGLGIFDEILSYLDERYIEELKGVLEASRARKLIVITHDSKLMNLFSDRILVTMKDGISQYETSWR